MSPQEFFIGVIAGLALLGYPMTVLAERRPQLRKRAYILNVLGIMLSGSTLALGVEHSLWIVASIWSFGFQNVMLANFTAKSAEVTR